tara:strand:- start:713 stop:859 length:147 start_codon:yes stop_codon:yes gene_type:complete
MSEKELKDILQKTIDSHKRELLNNGLTGKLEDLSRRESEIRKQLLSLN